MCIYLKETAFRSTKCGVIIYICVIEFSGLNIAQNNKEVKGLNILKLVLVLGMLVLLACEGYFGYRVHQLSNEREQVKKDYSLANNIRYGLFSVDQWRDKLVAVVSRQVKNFSMNAEQKSALQTQVEEQLHVFLNQAVAEINKPQTTLSGKLKKFAFNEFVNTDQLQAKMPGFARTIVERVNSPANINRLKEYATNKIGQLGLGAKDSISASKNEAIRQLYLQNHVTNLYGYNKLTDQRLASIHKQTYNSAYAMFGCVLLAAGLYLFFRKKIELQGALFIMLILFALILLAVGLTSSIIEVDARIQSLNFTLLGEKVAFENQVLFCKSKSVLNIIEILAKQPKPEAVGVAVLIFIFIILIPVLRIFGRCLYVLGTKRVSENVVVRYLCFFSGKWDMTSVMVVIIMMAYIGFNGILYNQLANLNFHSDFLTTSTINYTTLLPGYFVIAGYVIYGLVLSYIVKRITPRSAIVTQTELEPHEDEKEPVEAIPL